MLSKLSAPHFTNEDAAREYLEKLRWPNGPVCPHCGVVDKAYATKRPGKYRCSEKECRKDFTVKVGTVFEDSKIPLHKWLLATYLLCSSKKGMSSHQLHRTLEITYKSAWFMTHRIREAMRTGGFAPMGGSGKIVEADETFIGRKDGTEVKRGKGHKRAVLSLVERGAGVRSFHVDSIGAAAVMPILTANVDRESALMTDEAGQYRLSHEYFAAHGFTRHGKGEYGRGEIHSNTVEGYFSIFKRGMKGVYQHCGQRHLHRYLAEYDFRYNNRAGLGVDDAARADKALRGAEGKRLMYRKMKIESGSI